MATVPARRWLARTYGGPAALELVDESVPATPPAGAVLVRVLATTATYTDLLILRNSYRPAVTLPATPGYDMVGEVVAVGAGVVRLAAGDRVAAMPQGRCMATHVLLPERLCVKVRADVAPTAAAAVVLTGITAHQLLHRATGGRASAPGAKLLVHACAGGTGAMLVALAKAAGVPAGNIFGTCGARHLPAAAAAGITAFDYRVGGWDEALLRACPAGVDVVFDSVLLGGYLRRDLRVLRRGGKLLAYGLTNTAAPGQFHLPSAVAAFLRLAWQQRVVSWFTGTEAEFFNVAERRDARPADFEEDITLLMGMLAGPRPALDVGAVVGRVWRFEEARDALASIEAGAHTGKQVVAVAEPGRSA